MAPVVPPQVGVQYSLFALLVVLPGVPPSPGLVVTHAFINLGCPVLGLSCCGMHRLADPQGAALLVCRLSIRSAFVEVFLSISVLMYACLATD